MIAFLTKSTIALAVLLGIYYLLLEREKMHRFNRFYLLGALIFSYALPFMAIPIYTEAEAVPITLTQPTNTPLPLNQNQFNQFNQLPKPTATITQTAGITDYTPYIIWGLYTAVGTLLLIRFIAGIRKFYTSVKSHDTVDLTDATLVLPESCPQPHSFLRYIFVSKQQYSSNAIENELLEHELAHVRQRHTIDVLFIELLKTVFWFNPLLYLYKRAIQLNHEFLADERTINQYKNIPTYQKMLLDKALPHTAFALASSINFGVTKKRFIMMTKTTTKTRSILLKSVLVPAIAGLIYTAGTKTVAKQQPVKPAAESTLTVKDSADFKQNNNANFSSVQAKTGKPGGELPTEAEYFKGVHFVKYDRADVTKRKIKFGKVLFSKVYEDMTPEDREDFKIMMHVPKPYVKHSPTAAEFKDFQNSKKYAIWIDGKNVPNTQLAKLKPNGIAYFSGSVILKNARTKQHPQPFQYWFYTHKYFDAEKMGEVTQRHYSGDSIQIWVEDRKAE